LIVTNYNTRIETISNDIVQYAASQGDTLFAMIDCKWDFPWGDIKEKSENFVVEKMLENDSYILPDAKKGETPSPAYTLLGENFEKEQPISHENILKWANYIIGLWDIHQKRPLKEHKEDFDKIKYECCVKINSKYLLNDGKDKQPIENKQRKKATSKAPPSGDGNQNDEGDSNSDDDDDSNDLLKDLIHDGIMPSFAFPLDVCNFHAEGSKYPEWGGTTRVRVQYASTSQSMKVALSEYAPGRRLVIKKYGYEVRGLYIPHKEWSDPINRGRDFLSSKDSIEVDNLRRMRWYNRCDYKGCNWVWKFTDLPFNSQKPLPGNHGNDVSINDYWTEKGCPACNSRGSTDGGDLRSTLFITPFGFSPEVIPHDAKGQAVRKFEPLRLSKQTTPTKSEKASLMRPEDNSVLTADLDSGERIHAQLPSPLLGGSEGDEDDLIENWPLERDVQGWGRLKLCTMRKDEDGESISEMIMVNRGSKAMGYTICYDCARIRHVGSEKDGPEVFIGAGDARQISGHHRPYIITKHEIYGSYEGDKIGPAFKQAQSRCNGDYFLNPLVDTDFSNEEEGVALGFTFRTDLVSLRLVIDDPLNHHITSRVEFRKAMNAVTEAFVTAMQETLELVDREIQGGYRLSYNLLEVGGRTDVIVDIYAYDDVSGGAELVTGVIPDGDDDSLLLDVLRIMAKILGGERCISGEEGEGCDEACIGCLLDFRNKGMHGRMSRKLGHQLFRLIESDLSPSPDDCDILFDSRAVEKTPRYRLYQSLQSILNNVIDIEIIEVPSQNGRPSFALAKASKNGKELYIHTYSMLVTDDSCPERERAESYIEGEEGCRARPDNSNAFLNRDSDSAKGRYMIKSFEVLEDSPQSILDYFVAPSQYDDDGV